MDTSVDERVTLGEYASYMEANSYDTGYDAFLAAAYDDFVRGEGKLNQAYVCKNGYPTIGVGALFYDPNKPNAYRSRYVGFNMRDPNTGALLTREQKEANYDLLIKCMQEGTVSTRQIPGAGSYIDYPPLGKMDDAECRRVFNNDVTFWYGKMKETIPNLDQYPVKAQLAIVHMGFGGLKPRLDENLKGVDKNDPEAVMAVVERICTNVRVSSGMMNTIREARAEIAEIKSGIVDGKILSEVEREIDYVAEENLKQSAYVEGLQEKTLNEFNGILARAATLETRADDLLIRQEALEASVNKDDTKRLKRISSKYPRIASAYEAALNNENIEDIKAGVDMRYARMQVSADNLRNIEGNMQNSIGELSEVPDEIKGRHMSLSSRLEDAERRLDIHDSISSDLSVKEENIYIIDGEAFEANALLDDEEAVLNAKEIALRNYQMVVDLATLPNKMIKDKYGVSRRELTHMVENIERGEDINLGNVEVKNPNVDVSLMSKTSNVDVELEVVEPDTDLTSVKDISVGYSPEERLEVIEIMEEQRTNAEKQVQVNETLIKNGAYGVSGDGKRIDVALNVNPREKTQEEINKENRMNRWVNNGSIESQNAKLLIEKYGVEVAHDLVLKSLTSPSEVCQGVGTNFMSSKKCINYFLNNEISDEIVAKVIGRDVTEVHSKRADQTKSKATVLSVEMNPVLRDKLYGAPSL